MHEMPIVLNVVRSLDQMADKKNITAIGTVVMQIGELASVMPRYFRSCWVPAVERSKHLKTAFLEIEIIPGIAKCRRCETEFHIETNEGLCPNCKVWEWDLVSGRDVTIKEILVKM